MLAIILVPLALAGLLYIVLVTGRRAKNLPPGPPTLPVLGNLHQIPRKGSYLKFTEWAKQYGGLYSLKLGTGTAVVITDGRIIKELVDKKSAKYSNRPVSYVSHDLMTSGDHLLVMQYGQQWRTFRKLIHQYFREAMVEKEHVEVQNAEAVQMLRDMCVRPDQHMRHPKRYSNSIIMSLVFGFRTPSVETPHMTRLYDMMENWSQLMEPGATPPVDIYPFLHYVPQKLFGNWVSRSKNVGDEMNELYAGVLDRVRERRRSNKKRDCLMDSLLDEEDKLNLTRHQLYFLGGVLMEGGSDTSSSIIVAFIHAMTKWGHVLRKAQEEIDTVVGEDRTPVWSDYAQLPYVATIVKEAQRWRPVVPLAFPHAAAEDDWIDGYLIPKDTVVIINGWGMHHDEKRFPNPEIFDPDHYKGQTTLAPELAAAADYESRDHYGYGSGRRICPGIHLAERNLFLAIAKLIWAFSIGPALDENGQPVQYDYSPETGYSEGFLVCAKDFPCVIKPRSEARRATIMKEFEVAQRDVFSRFDV
ncbi:cytochrome P450 [Penicillium cataractarum]|uniref:Cytochrome P450 n=1 Tax=Penicillium cataractarum TaxID=2100454 RepID=A0A9W9VWM6_9EURO|nr:cytochrome P450 [Penicillium cataractarum]KAJ5390698.1 cytochrome P450 [Penicillium cataractarum]